MVLYISSLQKYFLDDNIREFVRWYYLYTLTGWWWTQEVIWGHHPTTVTSVLPVLYLYSKVDTVSCVNVSYSRRWRLRGSDPKPFGWEMHSLLLTTGPLCHPFLYLALFAWRNASNGQKNRLKGNSLPRTGSIPTQNKLRMQVYTQKLLVKSLPLI